MLEDFDYFLIHKMPEEAGGHWLWTGKIDKHGYGRQKFGNRKMMAHRWVFECVNQRMIEPKVQLDHTCPRTLDDMSDEGLEMLREFFKIPEHRLEHEYERHQLKQWLMTKLRCCVNPAHMEEVTNQVNSQRARHHNAAKTHCPNGHPYTPANTYKHNGRRKCRECNRIRARQYRREAASAAEAGS